ncbi:MAG TPA: hypothetical protein DD670_08860 [Planctomycetaceae bacterium]|nr:hypothetical protein [Planctomycetaceae bacterium]
MTKKRRHNEKLSEDDALQLVLKSHPEWRRQWERGTLPDEMLGEDGEPMSPHMHLQIHVVVERQLADDEPKGVVAVARELEQLGVSKHEVRHAIGRAVANQLWKLMHELREFDVDEYMAELREIVKSYQ